MLLVTVARDEYFLKVPKIETVLFDWVLLVFTIFSVFLGRKSKMNFVLPYLKLLTDLDIPSSHPLKRAGSGSGSSDSLIAAFISKSCSATHTWSWKLFRNPPLNVHWKKSTYESKGKLGQNDAAYTEQFFELVQ
jgi:hypothetical protein